MTRASISCGLVLLTGIGLWFSPLFGEEQSQVARPAVPSIAKPPTPVPASPAACPGCLPCPIQEAAHDELVEELVTILNETESPDTVILTASLLASMRPSAKKAVPAIIRGAERVGLLREHCGKATDATKQEPIHALAELIHSIALGKNPGEGERDMAAAQGGLCYPPPVAPSYPSPMAMPLPPPGAGLPTRICPPELVERTLERLDQLERRLSVMERARSEVSSTVKKVTAVER